MLTPSARFATLAISALAFSGSLALSQPPAQPASPAAPAAPAPSTHRMPAMPPPGMHGTMQMSHDGFHGPESHFGGGMEMGGFHMGPGGMWWKNPHIVERLSLTADQTKKMDEIVEHSRLDLIDLRANLEKQQVMLGPIMDSNPVDMARASAQIDKVANARADLEKSNAKMLLSIRDVLTPDQWTKLHERPAPPAQGAAAAGSSAASGPRPGSHWRGGRPGGSSTENLAPPIPEQ